MTANVSISTAGVVLFVASFAVITLYPSSASAQRNWAILNRANVSTSGVQDNRGVSTGRSVEISGNGRFIVFESNGTNLVAGDTKVADIFVHDQRTRVTTRVSVSSNGDQADGHSLEPSISDDGRFVSFLSDASNLVAGDTNQGRDVFVHDRLTGRTTRVSNGNFPFHPRLNADGRFVLFSSLPSNPVPGFVHNVDLYVYDRITGQTTLVSVAPDGGQFKTDIFDGDISDDGQVVAYGELRTSFNASPEQIYVRDRGTGQTRVISIGFDGLPANNFTRDVSISGDGRFVAYSSTATNLVPGDTNGGEDVFVHDLETGRTIRASGTPRGSQGNGKSLQPMISRNGRFVAFYSDASNLVGSFLPPRLGGGCFLNCDTNSAPDIFVHDVWTGQNDLISETLDGRNPSADQPSISRTGLFVAFRAFGANLLSGEQTEYRTPSLPARRVFNHRRHRFCRGRPPQ